MDIVIFDYWGVIITPWKLVGYAGILMFGGRWVIQALASRAAGRPHFPRLFWYMSLSGSLLLVLYFIFGKNDSVGILANLFPACIASYNLVLDYRYRRRQSAGRSSQPRQGSE